MDYEIETCDIEPGKVYHLGAVAFYLTPSGEYAVVDWATGRARLVHALAIVTGPAADIGGGFGQADEKGRWLVDAAYDYPPSVAILRRFAAAQESPADDEDEEEVILDPAVLDDPLDSKELRPSATERAQIDADIAEQAGATADGGTLDDAVSVQKE